MNLIHLHAKFAISSFSGRLRRRTPVTIHVENRGIKTIFAGKELAMGVLVTICPVTGRKIETGIETDQLSMARTPHFVARIDCPHCGTEHEFSNADIFVCEMVDGVIRYSRAA